MVHYDPKAWYAVQDFPPLCPKCGSHRTEIVGRTDDLKMIVLRCSACGARSEVPVEEETAAVA